LGERYRVLKAHSQTLSRLSIIVPVPGVPIRAAGPPRRRERQEWRSVWGKGRRIQQGSNEKHADWTPRRLFTPTAGATCRTPLVDHSHLFYPQGSPGQGPASSTVPCCGKIAATGMCGSLATGGMFEGGHHLQPHRLQYLTILLIHIWSAEAAIRQSVGGGRSPISTQKPTQ
jgi:hypothetical protein